MKAEDKINRLHEEVVRQTTDSEKCLHAALVAAWQAGQLLLAEKERVRRTMGAAWGQWIKEKFHGSKSTAHNYMRLAENTADVSDFAGLSLRQVYLRLGIATEPKCRRDSPGVAPLPEHIRLANRLLEALSRCEIKVKSRPEQSVLLRQDLQALYVRLRRLFEPGAAAGLPGRAPSDNNRP
ncbi:MAG TPA: hypothetical protein VMI53_03710 [Opitutaceae bacterium]|nr:hypothetical protein [Opitutaceae bacterium]